MSVDMMVYFDGIFFNFIGKLKCRQSELGGTINKSFKFRKCSTYQLTRLQSTSPQGWNVLFNKVLLETARYKRLVNSSTAT